MTTHRPFLMGAETEFAVSAMRLGQLMDPDDVYQRLAEGLQRRRAWARDHHATDSIYLGNGGRFYLDYGSHPEYATAECLTPRQVALHDKAGERLLEIARDEAMLADAEMSVRVVKNNLDPVEPECNTYGTHESYTLWGASAEAAPQLIPHLVSRTLYAGSGCLTGDPAGVGFELSQRARHLAEAEGDDTTCNRAIFGTRVRKVYDADGSWVRVHLISKDSQRAPFGTYLTFATTGLLIEMINRGYKVGEGLALADPVAAIQAISRDPLARAEVDLADGRRLSALEVQSAYLEEAEKALQRGNLPGWAGEAVGHWRDTLELLERDPRRLADRLDAYCKLLIVEHELTRAGYDWPDLRLAVRRLCDLRSGFGERVSRAVLLDSDAGLTPEELPQFAQARELCDGATPGTLDRLRFATRLQALDFQYHELGGLYDRLRGAGRMKDVILTGEEVEKASLVPPTGGRAAVRGAWIAAHPEPEWVADWQYVLHTKTGECIDLRDPFDGAERVRMLPLAEGFNPWQIDVLTVLAEQPVSA